MSMKLLVVLAAAAVTTATTGCATKRFVRNTVSPVSQQVTELDKRSAENARSIKDLDERTTNGISRVDEKAGAADSHAADAAKLAGQAGTQANQATEKADNARTLAESGLARAGRIEQVVENLDNYRETSTTTVYFAFDKSELGPDATKELDSLAQSLGNNRHYVIEVQGYTDKTGANDYNYALSERRASAVVRYLVTEHKIPAYRVYPIGMGKGMMEKATPVAHTTADDRKLSRRVEVRVYSPKLPEVAAKPEDKEATAAALKE